MPFVKNSIETLGNVYINCLESSNQVSSLLESLNNHLISNTPMDNNISANALLEVLEILSNAKTNFNKALKLPKKLFNNKVKEELVDPDYDAFFELNKDLIAIEKILKIVKSKIPQDEKGNFLIQQLVDNGIRTYSFHKDELMDLIAPINEYFK